MLPSVSEGESSLAMGEADNTAFSPSKQVCRWVMVALSHVLQSSYRESWRPSLLFIVWRIFDNKSTFVVRSSWQSWRAKTAVWDNKELLELKWRLIAESRTVDVEKHLWIDSLPWSCMLVDLFWGSWDLQKFGYGVMSHRASDEVGFEEKDDAWTWGNEMEQITMISNRKLVQREEVEMDIFSILNSEGYQMLAQMVCHCRSFIGRRAIKIWSTWFGELSADFRKPQCHEQVCIFFDMDQDRLYLTKFQWCILIRIGS